MLPPRPPTDLVSRVAEPADAPALAALAARTFSQAFEALNDPADLEAYVGDAFSVTRIERQLAEPESIFLLAAEAAGAEPVGYCRLVGGTRGKPIEGPRPVELERLYVDAGGRNRGYGSALLWDGMALAYDLGYRTIWLGVWEKNPGARRFYARWGFEAVGSHEFVLGSDRQNDLLLARSI